MAIRKSELYSATSAFHPPLTAGALEQDLEHGPGRRQWPHPSPQGLGSDALEELAFNRASVPS